MTLNDYLKSEYRSVITLYVKGDDLQAANVETESSKLVLRKAMLRQVSAMLRPVTTEKEHANE